MANTNRGTITLMGSGEMAESMSRVHRKILSNIQGDPHPVFLDTPAGFELNADEISERAIDYFSLRFSLALQVATFKNKSTATAIDVEAALRKLRRADFIFAGPGSPSYAIRNWVDTPVWETVQNRFLEGAQLVFASAAAITTGCCSLPVYEIYKAGQDAHWIPGLNLLGQLGLSVAVIPHWNNSEGGTFDTRFCYMGAPRLERLEQQLDPSTVILGIDEYTACIIEPEAGQCSVMGAGQVTVRHQGQEWTYPSGTTFDLERLRADPGMTEAPLPVAAADTTAASPGSATAGRYLHELAHALSEAREDEIQRDLIEQAHDAVHELSAGWHNQDHAAQSGDITPLIELLMDLRGQLRAAKQYGLADQVRQSLAQLGYELKDTPNGTVWTKTTNG